MKPDTPGPAESASVRFFDNLIGAVIESRAQRLTNFEKILVLLIFRSSKMADC